MHVLIEYGVDCLKVPKSPTDARTPQPLFVLGLRLPSSQWGQSCRKRRKRTARRTRRTGYNTYPPSVGSEHRIASLQCSRTQRD